MPAPPKVHGVAETGERLVYHVASDRPGVAPWRVDMEPFDGFGACNCPDFTQRRKGEPSRRDRLEAGERTLDCACKHLRRAHLFNSMKFNRLVLAEVDRNKPRFQSDAERNW